jgi:hypothetical protein
MAAVAEVAEVAVGECHSCHGGQDLRGARWVTSNCRRRRGGVCFPRDIGYDDDDDDDSIDDDDDDDDDEVSPESE